MTNVQHSHVTDQLRELRDRAGLSMDALAREIGYRAASGYQRYESAEHYRRKYLPVELVHKLANVLVGRGRPPITRDEVLALAGLGAVVGSTAPIFNVPVLSWVQAGKLAEAMDSQQVQDGAEKIPTYYKRDSLFALRVRGGSMNRVAPDGAVVLCDYEDRSLTDGRCYIFRVDGDATFKRYRANPDRLEPDSVEAGHIAIFPSRGLEVVARVVRVIIDNP